MIAVYFFPGICKYSLPLALYLVMYGEVENFEKLNDSNDAMSPNFLIFYVGRDYCMFF